MYVCSYVDVMNSVVIIFLIDWISLVYKRSTDLLACNDIASISFIIIFEQQSSYMYNAQHELQI